MKQGIMVAVALLTTAAAPVRPVKVERNGPALDFTYSYPPEAAAIPLLNRRFQTDLATRYRKALRLGLEDQKIYTHQKRGDISDFFSMEWTTAGQSQRLLSLQNQLSTFTGGAHPNTSYGTLLWDRRSNREIKLDSLFLRDGAFEAQSRVRYCAALDVEQKKRRGGEPVSLPDFNKCPNYSELAVALVDKNRNSRFDSILAIASPYVAGPYAEGEYQISIPVTSQLINAIKPEFRNAFERQRQ